MSFQNRFNEINRLCIATLNSDDGGKWDSGIIRKGVNAQFDLEAEVGFPGSHKKKKS